MAFSRRSILKGAALLASQTIAAPILSNGARAASAPAHSLKMAWIDSKLNPGFSAAERFAERVKTLTNGDVIVQLYGLGELGSQTNILTSLQTGLVDFCVHTTGYAGSLMPRFQLLDLPYFFPSEAAAERLVDGPIGRELLNDMGQRGLTGLGYGWWGWRAISTTKQSIANPSDIKGLRIRVQSGPIYAATYRALGANPVFIDFAEVYLALSQGTIDGLEVPITGLMGIRAHEVLKHVNTSRQVYNPGIFMASTAKFERLSPKYQEAIRTAASDYAADSRATMKKAIVETGAQLKSFGLNVGEVNNDAYRSLTAPVYGQFREIIGADLVARAQKQLG